MEFLYNLSSMPPIKFHPSYLREVMSGYIPTKMRLENIRVPNDKCMMVNTDVSHDRPTNYLFSSSSKLTRSSL